MCFNDVNGNAMTINQAVPFADGMTKGLSGDTADMLQVMGDDGQYTNYFLSNGKYGKGGASYSEEFDGKWLKSAGAANTDTITTGQAFWYVSRGAATTPHTVTVAGAVLTSTSNPKDCALTYNLLANPYACDVPINGGLVVTGTTKGLSGDTADMLQVMGSDGQYTNYFLSNGKYGKGGASYSEEFDGKWLKSAGSANTDSIPAGASFWYVSRSQSGTVQLINPIEE